MSNQERKAESTKGQISSCAVENATNSNGKFTPAPWVVGGSDTTTQIWVCAQRGLRICTLKPSEQDLSNARLIAAAPDLLAALERVLSHERDIVYLFNRLGEGSPANFSLDCEKARAAIAKAQL